MKILIVIPARYGSTRLPAKPLLKIAGRKMIDRVVDIAKQSIKRAQVHCDLVVATDHQEILDECQNLNVRSLLTDESCTTGTHRTLDVINKLDSSYNYAINIQGDAPLTPPSIIESMISTISNGGGQLEMVTPITRLSWKELDDLRESKKTTPFSGCTVCLKNNGDAHWFSKNIIPGIRDEQKRRESSDLSPVNRHIGIYGYRIDILKKYLEYPVSPYEDYEGLEQLRFLESGVRIRTISVSFGDKPSFSGVDSPEDVVRADRYIATYGDPYSTC
jgi:3-deoxy-manno-octulosonate cytidylyltransferase (CMP-KDO synthetase)